MAEHSIYVEPPSWETMVKISLEVLRVNEWYGEAGKDARKWLYELAQFMDVINNEHLLAPEDAKYVLDKVRKVEA